MYEDYNNYENQNHYQSGSTGDSTANQTDNTSGPSGMYGHGPTDENPQYRYASYQVNRSYVPEEPKKSPKKKGGFVKKAAVCVSLGLLFGIFAGTGFYGVNLIADKVNGVTGSTNQNQNTESQKPVTTTTASQNSVLSYSGSGVENAVMAKASVLDASDVAENVMPSVVSITNMYTQTIQSFWGQRGEYQNESSGSGIIVGENDSELLIATNNHVVSDSDSLSVQFIDGSVAEAQLKGAQSDVDLAVIAVDLNDLSAETKSQIKVAVLGDSEQLKVGEPAIAIGNSLGYGQSVTSGVISALNREVTVDNVTNELIQTDAAINPGNSGGALLNINGEVIGINAVKYSSAEVEGMGYAIPISTAQPIIDELMNRETKKKVAEADGSYLGISGIDVTAEVSNAYGMPIGIYVAQVVEGSAAANAGIARGCIITSFDGQSVRAMSELQDLMQYYAAGTTVDVTIQQGSADGYVEKNISVTLGRKTS